MSVLGDGEMLPADAKKRGERRGQRFMETRRPACPPAVSDLAWSGLLPAAARLGKDGRWYVKPGNWRWSVNGVCCWWRVRG